jgi:hypothetical protein
MNTELIVIAGNDCIFQVMTRGARRGPALAATR